jgi:signal peptidase I
MEGNFALLLFLATVVRGLYWLAERFYFLPRAKAAQALEEQAVPAPRRTRPHGHAKVDGDVPRPRAALLMQPWWLDWTAGCSR